jgi:hypothetical protein
LSANEASAIASMCAIAAAQAQVISQSLFVDPDYWLVTLRDDGAATRPGSSSARSWDHRGKPHTFGLRVLD